MDEILALQRELAEVQVTASASKLSERNCIELVSKLQSLSLVNLIYTRTGKEYLTPSKLQDEIEDEILMRGGRVNVIDIPEALNVDLAHVEAALPAVVERAVSPTRIVNGEVVSDTYLATLAEDVDASLAQSASGIDDVGQIASRTNLPVGIIRDCLKAHVGSVIRATIDDASGQLRSFASLERAVATARGALRAAAAPAGLKDMADRHDVPAEIMLKTAADMLASGTLAGRTDGTGLRAIFLPAVFERAAKASAQATFVGSGFLSVDSLRALNVSDPHEFARKEVPGAVCVGSIVVGPSLLETLESSALEAVDCSSWLDLQAALPPSFPGDHVRHIVDLIKHSGKPPAGNAPSRGKGSSKRKGKPTADRSEVNGNLERHQRDGPALDGPVVARKFLVSNALLGNCVEVVKRDAKERASNRARRIFTMSVVVGSASRAETVTDDDIGSGKAKKSKPRRRKDKQTTGEKSSGGSIGRGTIPVEIPSFEDVCELIRNDKVCNSLEADYLGNAPLDEDELITAVVEEGMGSILDGGLSSMYEAEASAAVEVFERERAAARLELERQIVSGLERAETYKSAASTLSRIPGGDSESRRHVLETSCRSTVESILKFIASGSGVSLAPEKDVTISIPDLLKQLPNDITSRARGLVSAVTGKKMAGVDEFLEAYDEASPDLDLPPRRPLDKKRERATNSILRSELDAMLNGANQDVSCIDALSGCAVLLYARCHGGTVVSIPPKLVPALCDFLESGVLRPEAAVESLAALRKAVTSELRMIEDGCAPPNIPEHVRDAVEKVRTFVILNQ